MEKLKSQLESLLFISAKPMSVNQLADLLKISKEDVAAAGDRLVDEYRESGRGVQIVKNGKNYQMVSSPDNAQLVQEFIKDETTGELTRPSLEALTIIAYRGPIAKIDLDRIRGVNCALIIRNLLLRGLIEAKYDNKLKQNYYNATMDFIRFLGINDLKELPDFERLAKDDAIDRVLAGAEGAPEVPADVAVESTAEPAAPEDAEADDDAEALKKAIEEEGLPDDPAALMKEEENDDEEDDEDDDHDIVDIDEGNSDKEEEI